MSVISLAIIGKNNKPIYLKEFFDEEDHPRDLVDVEVELFGLPPPAKDPKIIVPQTCSLRQQFLFHGALDRLEQLAGPPPGVHGEILVLPAPMPCLLDY